MYTDMFTVEKEDEFLSVWTSLQINTQRTSAAAPFTYRLFSHASSHYPIFWLTQNTAIGFQKIPLSRLKLNETSVCTFNSVKPFNPLLWSSHKNRASQHSGNWRRENWEHPLWPPTMDDLQNVLFSERKQGNPAHQAPKKCWWLGTLIEFVSERLTKRHQKEA